MNPFIGIAFTGHTFPGATYPLGMMQPGPETGNFSWENMYVDKIEWNGAPYEQNFITYEQIMGGGTLLFHMTDTPKDR